MQINRRLWYATRFGHYLSLHPEHVNTFITRVCDEISIADLDAIYRQMQEISKQPQDPVLTKFMEN